MPVGVTGGERPLEFHCDFNGERGPETQPAGAKEHSSGHRTLGIRVSAKLAPDRAAALCDIAVSLEPGPSGRSMAAQRHVSSTVRLGSGGLVVPCHEPAADQSGQTEWWLILVARSI